MRMIPPAMFGLSALALAGACALPQDAQDGPVQVSQGGSSYLVDVTPGPAGRVLTAAGAVAVQGRMLVVARTDGPIGHDEGLVAKAVAEQGCVTAGGRFNPSAIGRFGAGRWHFAGACA